MVTIEFDKAKTNLFFCFRSISGFFMVLLQPISIVVKLNLRCSLSSSGSS
jgi:hypothetical protein